MCSYNFKIRRQFLIYLLPIISSCTDSKLPKYVELNELRVLTLIADKPETAPSSSVTITPVISDINETTSLSYEAYGCVDPGIAAGADPSCDGNSTKVSLANNTITSSSTADMAENFTGLAPSFNVNIPTAELMFFQRSAIDKFNGVSYIVTYKITNSSGKSVQTFKRIIVSEKSTSDLNLNPEIQQVQANGQNLTSANFPLNGIYNLQLDYTANSVQSYPFQKSDGSQEARSEELITTWFITDGSLKYFRTTNKDSNQFTAPETLSTSRKSFLFSVTRDSRGGIAVKRICGGC